MNDDYREDMVEEDGDSVVVPVKGPLSRPPRLKHIHPAVQLFLLFLAGTFIYQGYSFGVFLPASGEAVFARHEYWRIFTSLFTHSGLSHLLANSWIFVVFGWLLRSYFGPAVFPFLSLILGGAVNGVTLLFYDPAVNLVGASGMIHAMIGLWIVLYVRFDSAHSVSMRLFRAAGFSLAMLVPQTVEVQVSYLAHGAGFVMGIAAGVVVIPFVRVVAERNVREENVHD